MDQKKQEYEQKKNYHDILFLETLYIAVHGSINELSCGGKPSGVNYILPFQWSDIGVTN